MSSPVYGVRSRPLGQTSYYQGPFELKAGDYVLVAAEPVSYTHLTLPTNSRV